MLSIRTRSFLASCFALAAVHATAQDLIAHRGNTTNAIENSVPAVQAAWSAGADAVEIDVRVATDGVVYLFHDDKIKRRRVVSFSYADVVARAGPRAVPRLKNVLALAGASGYYVLDLKEVRAENVVRITDAVNAAGFAAGRLVFQSDDLETLDAVKRALPDSRVYFLSKLQRRYRVLWRPGADKLTQLLKGRNVDGVSLKGRRYIDREFVQTLQTSGLAVNVWTVNAAKRVTHYMDIGVDGIITDNIPPAK